MPVIRRNDDAAPRVYSNRWISECANGQTVEVSPEVWAIMKEVGSAKDFSLVSSNWEKTPGHKELLLIPGITPDKADTLMEAGIRSPEDLLNEDNIEVFEREFDSRWRARILRSAKELIEGKN